MPARLSNAEAAKLGLAPKRAHKYRARPCYVRERGLCSPELIPGEQVQRFHSRKEAERYIVLRHHEICGIITGLRCQVPFVIGKVGNRDVKYICDFVYEKDGKKFHEDVKGHRTRAYLRAKKAMLDLYQITILET